MKITGKKIFLFGFLAVLLVGIPVTVYLLQQQQETRSHAEKSTTISFSPDSTQSTPITKNVGDSVPLDVTINPGTNLVDFVKLEIDYDATKFQVDQTTGFQANTSVFPSVLEGPVYTPGKIAVTLSVGPDPTKAIQTTVKAGTVTLKAIAGSDSGNPASVTFDANTQVLSTGPNDQASENVLSSTLPAYIQIGGGTTVTGTPAVTAIPTPAPTVEAFPTAIPTPIPTGAGKISPATPPLCSALTVDKGISGTAPFSVTFGATGSDSSGTVNKVTFNFGDGQVSDVTQGGGIGTAAVNAQVAHTYTAAGTYQASAVITDSNNTPSAPDSCTQTITVKENTAGAGAGAGTGTGAGGGGGAVAVARPSMGPTGSTDVTVGIGVVSLLLVIGGSFVFFVL